MTNKPKPCAPIPLKAARFSDVMRRMTERGQPVAPPPRHASAPAGAGASNLSMRFYRQTDEEIVECMRLLMEIRSDVQTWRFEKPTASVNWHEAPSHAVDIVCASPAAVESVMNDSSVKDL